MTFTRQTKTGSSSTTPLSKISNFTFFDEYKSNHNFIKENSKYPNLDKKDLKSKTITPITLNKL